MTDPGNAVEDRDLERQGRVMGHSAGRFLLVGLLIAIPGVILVLIGSIGIGAAVLLLASIPGAVGIGLLVSSAISRWSARHKSFA